MNLYFIVVRNDLYDRILVRDDTRHLVHVGMMLNVSPIMFEFWLAHLS